MAHGHTSTGATGATGAVGSTAPNPSLPRSNGDGLDAEPSRTGGARGFILSWDELARDRLRTLCQATEVVDVVGFARDLRSAMQFLRAEAVDVVLVELDAARAPAGVVGIVRSVLPDVRIVVWGDDVTHFEDAFDAGADAWVSRSATPETLTAAVTGLHTAARRR